MAGIGFELKKIFNERNLVNMVKGTVYSALTIVGPMIITILGIIGIFITMGLQYIDFYQRDLLMSIILYAFIFSAVLTNPLSVVISRYVADKIFDEKYDDIAACYYAGLLTNSVLAAAIALPFVLRAIFAQRIDPLIMILAAMAFIALVLLFFNMTFITALKEFRSIVIAFFVGILTMLAVSIQVFSRTQLGFVISVLIGMVSGFSLIAILLFAMVRKFFNKNSHNYLEFFTYLRRYKFLFLASLLHTLGLYIHNFIFWFDPTVSLAISNTFRSAPAYDLAVFLAMLTNISALVIFTVRVEVHFHEKYQVYCQQILGGMGGEITKAKSSMFAVLLNEIVYIVHLQLVITAGIFLIVNMFSQSLGFGGLTMIIYPTLAAGYFAAFIMYAMLIFLYYFSDEIGALMAAAAFFAGTFAATLVARQMGPQFFGLGLFFGAFAGWSVAYFRLRHIEANLDYMIFCKGEIVKKVLKK